jgi:phenylacetate-CoA ligase
MSFRTFTSDKFVNPLLLRFAQHSPWKRYEELLELDNADADTLEKIQWERFQSIIEYAGHNVPYYKESFAAAGVRAEDLSGRKDLPAVPTINKQKIAANFPDRITSKKSDPGMWRYVATSGTTDRLMVVKDAETSSRNEALIVYGQQLRGTYAPGLIQSGIPPDACSLACAANVRRAQGPLDKVRESYESLTVNGLSGMPRSLVGRTLRRISQPYHEMPSFGTEGTRVSVEMLQWYVEQLHRLSPTVLSGLPTFLQFLARHIDRSKTPLPRIGSLLPEGALSPPILKNELFRAFGVPVHEVYGAHELGSVATTCEQRDKLHIMMPEFLVETVRNGKHADSGELGEIVITSFINRAMPLIRYTPGDVGRLYEDQCPCGRKTQLLTLEGRLQDTIVTSKGIFTAQAIIEFFDAYPNIEFFQLVQRSEARCDLLVVEKERGQTNMHDVSDAAEDFLGEEMQIRPRLVSTIKPEVSGKFRFVKSTSYHLFHEVVSTQASESKNDGFQAKALN